MIKEGGDDTSRGQIMSFVPQCLIWSWDETGILKASLSKSWGTLLRWAEPLLWFMTILTFNQFAELILTHGVYVAREPKNKALKYPFKGEGQGNCDL